MMKRQTFALRYLSIFLLLATTGCDSSASEKERASGRTTKATVAGSAANSKSAAGSESSGAKSDVPSRGIHVESSTHVSGGQKWAILVGVNDYDELQDLSYCAADARSLRDQLTQVGFQKDHVFLLSDGAQQSKYLPSKSKIERQLTGILNLTEKGDLVLFAFSGHGMHDPDEKKSYLCPSSAQIDDPKGTMISLDLVYDRLSESSATWKLLWVDACRNDPRPSGSRSAAVHAKSLKALGQTLQEPPEGIVALSSCKPGQVSWEDEKLGHGIFMHYLLEGLGGKADREIAGNRDNQVSIWELFRYSSDRTKTYVWSTRNRVQIPVLKGEFTGNCVLASLGRRPTPPPVRPTPSPSRPTPQPTQPTVSNPKNITNSLGMKLTLIPAGTFQMGSPDSEENRNNDEGPRHRVRITKPYYLGIHEVTQGQYEEIMGKNPSYFSSSGDGSDRVEGKSTHGFPVEGVSWNEAVEFCKKLSSKEGRTYRLPTEAEWEYACRAGTTTPFHFGRTLNGHKANTGGNHPYGTKDKGPYLKRPRTVGSYSANAFGLYDMHGNVWEWCQDRYASDYYKNSPSTDPTGPSSGSSRVRRGGSWGYYARNCRSANRSGFTPDSRRYYLGFRLALVPAE